jgi:RNA 3'-terminal phosphate cyclase-like protein
MSKAGPSTPGNSSRVLSFRGHARLRHRLVLSLLSRRPVRIDRIRPDDDEPGLKAHEVSFLRLIEKLTQGSRLEISYTGTSLLFHPGTIQNGQVTHSCPHEGEGRAVGWYLEPLLALAPFGKKDLVLTLRGVTTNAVDPSVDTIRTSGLPHLAMFLDRDGVELRVRARLAGFCFPLWVAGVGNGTDTPRLPSRRLRNEVTHPWEAEK